jgi:hypothetical protein
VHEDAGSSQDWRAGVGGGGVGRRWRSPEEVEEAGVDRGGRSWWRRPEVTEEVGGGGGSRRTSWPSVQEETTRMSRSPK